MLMACQKKIKICFFRKPAGNVLFTFREQYPFFQILFKPAVIDTDPQITEGLQM